MQAANQRWRPHNSASGMAIALELAMISTQSSDKQPRFYDTSIPDSVIPTRRTPWFMKALWALALLMLVGIVYSFWRISNVASPRLDIPQTQTQSTDTATPR
jgi:hypothetical protein